jgi:hypothetical protein
MAKGTIKSSEEYLRSVELPEKTETYTVISHGDVIDKVNEQLTKNGFSIVESEYFHIAEGKIARSVIHLECDKDPDMGMVFTWWNSYNKQVKFGCAIGGLIHDNKATLIGTEGLSWARKHTGTSDDEAWTVITELIENGNDYFDKVIVEKNKMQAMPLSIEDFGCVMGALYFEHDLITPTQASATKQAYRDTDANNCLWDLYKHLMYGIDGMDLKKWAKSQQKLHHMIMTEYLIAQEDNVQELADAIVEPLKSNHELPLSNISGDLPEKEEDFDWNTQGSEPEVTAVIDGVPHPIEAVEAAGELKNVDSVIVEKTIPVKELSVDEIELIKEEKGPIESTQVEEDPETPAEKSPQEQFKMAIMATGYSEDLTDFFIADHFDESISVEENIQTFCDWAPEKSPKPNELEVIEVDEDNLVEDPIQLASEMTGEVQDLELEDAIEISDDDFEAQLEAAFDTENVIEEVKKEEESKPEIKPVEDLTEPVPLLPPKESKKASPKKEEKKKPEGIKTKEEDDFLDVKAHEGLEVPAELLQEASIIEKKMAELYGSVRPYQVNKTEANIFVTIDESQESFYIPV